MANELVKLDKKTIDEAAAAIELVTKSCDMIKLSEMKALEQAVTLSRGIQALKKVITQQITEEIFMPLQGSPLGFLTDRDREKDPGYPAVIVRNCMIQGLMWGLQPVNNEINLIAEKAYAAKNGLERKVREAVRDLIIRPGVPVAAGDKTALLAMRAYWSYDGKRCELIKDVNKVEGGISFDERYAIRVNSGMGPDAVIGKAYRKLYRDILQQITNNAFIAPIGDVVDVTGEVIDSPAPSPVAPERDGQRVSVSTRAQQKPAPAAKSEPKNEAPGISKEELREVKRLAIDAGEKDIVDACVRIQNGSAEFDDGIKVSDWAAANRREPGQEG
jgi:hypothetical protein